MGGREGTTVAANGENGASGYETRAAPVAKTTPVVDSQALRRSQGVGVLVVDGVAVGVNDAGSKARVFPIPIRAR